MSAKTDAMAKDAIDGLRRSGVHRDKHTAGIVLVLYIPPDGSRVDASAQVDGPKGPVVHALRTLADAIATGPDGPSGHYETPGRLPS